MSLCALVVAALLAAHAAAAPPLALRALLAAAATVVAAAAPGDLPSLATTPLPNPSPSPTPPATSSSTPQPTPSRLPDYAKIGYLQFRFDLPLLRVDGESCPEAVSWLLGSGAGAQLRQLWATALGVPLRQVLVMSASDSGGSFISGSALAGFNDASFVPAEALRCGAPLARRAAPRAGRG